MKSISLFLLFLCSYFAVFSQKTFRSVDLNLESLPDFDTLPVASANFETRVYIVAGKYEVSVSATPFLVRNDSLGDFNCGFRKEFDDFKADAIMDGKVRYQTLSLGDDYKRYCECEYLDPHALLLNEILNGRFFVEYRSNFDVIGSVVLSKRRKWGAEIIYLKTLSGDTIFRLKERKCH